MKVKQLMLGMLAFGMLTACSNEEGLNPNGGNEISGDGKYMAITVNLPTTTGSTRAANDNYDDGLANEYKVFNGCLVIFKGANPTSATFAAAYDLQALTPEEDQDNDNITTSYLRSVKLDNLKYTDNDNLYGFVMLNFRNIATVDANGGLTIKTSETESVALTNEMTFKDAFVRIANTPFYQGTGLQAYNFFMCNSPLSNKEGTNQNPSGLSIIDIVELNKTKIYDTQAEAETKGNSAASINVERGVAKATLNWEAKGFDAKSKVAAADNAAISFNYIGWALDVCESSSYIMRNVQDADWWAYNNESAKNYRFVGNKKIGDTSIQADQDLYRTYWCYDPHYDKDLEYTQITTPAGDDNLLEKTNPLYCYENTFNIAYQNYKNTTRAVFQVTLGFAKDGEQATSKTFYVLDGKEDQLFTELSAVESYPRNAIIGSLRVHDALAKALKKDKEIVLTTEEITKMLDITFERNAKDGVRSVSAIKFKNLTDLKDEDADLKAKFASQPTLTEDDINILKIEANSYKIEEYDGGRMYYDARFMHFAGEGTSDLAPWNVTDEVDTTAEAYGDNANDYLGRWGMVRNNWYEINVSSVKHLGSPVIPDANVTTSDDNNIKEKHMALTINVLSWAKRTQSVEF